MSQLPTSLHLLARDGLEGTQDRQWHPGNEPRAVLGGVNLGKSLGPSSAKYGG